MQPRRRSLILYGSLALIAGSGAAFADQATEAGTPTEVVGGAPQAEATLFPIPDYAGNLSSRAALTGEWGGIRTAMAERGIQVAIDVTQAYQGVIDGGANERADYQGTADYRLLFDSGKAGLWPGGFLEVHAESFWGLSVNTSEGALLPTNFSHAVSAPAGNGTYLSHLTFTQFLSERFAITAGKIDTSLGDHNDYAHRVGRQRFMNAGFNLNPVTYYATPYAPLGGGFIFLLGDNKQHLLSVLAWDTDAAIDSADFDSLFEGNTSYAAELRLLTNFFGKKGHQMFGVIYGDGTFSSLDQSPELQFSEGGVRPGIDRGTEDSTWTFFYNFDQTLVADPANPGQDWGVFGRFGIADQKTNLIRTFYSIGLGGTGLFPARAQDRFGLGYYHMNLSNEVDLIPTYDTENTLEVFYTIQVLPSTELTADLQVIDGAIKRADNAIVGAVRIRMMF
jgi:porin